MIVKGTTHNNGAKLARYLITGKDGERAELWQLRGFADRDIVNAFRDVHIMAAATHCEKPFFHVQVRNPAGDRVLTRDEWAQIADRIEAKIGYSGQPRAIAFHIDLATGHEHMHIAWARIDADTMTVKPLPFYKLRLKEIARELEDMFDLTRVKNARAPHEPRAATRAEAEQARRLGVDGRAIRQAIRNAFERSDTGASFQQTLAAIGLILARGDRRDFVVIDQAGGLHALGARLLGVTAAEIRAKLADLDPAALPSVAEARARQQARRRPPRGQGGTGNARRREKPPPKRTPRSRKGKAQHGKHSTATRAMRRQTPPLAKHERAAYVRPIRPPTTEKNVRIKPVKVQPGMPQTPRARLTATTGTRKHFPWRSTRKPPPVLRPRVQEPRRPAGMQRAFSTQGELYRFHKANGTLQEYYRLFGLDYAPE
jgi:hypothetical protein